MHQPSQFFGDYSSLMLFVMETSIVLSNVTLIKLFQIHVRLEVFPLCQSWPNVKPLPNPRA
ncbi:hypothetical protein J2X19_002322 [Rhodoferax ferrireducens]|uniref:Uncharacterized protein n=1 Tax=Rhodoferax ferrireducens TaxID=192843 RepID=A0ABU2C8J7_9BURK|nr:hypothetical protein [Rhodoferax ferrireducens]